MKKTKEVTENVTGLSIKEINEMDFDDEIAYIEQKTKKRMSFSDIKGHRFFGRGNPLLARRRFTTISELDKRITGLVGK